MGLLAPAMGFTEPWLHQSPDEVIADVLTATAATHPALRGITLERLKADGAVPLDLGDEPPFADGRFPTPSGKVELYCEALADAGARPAAGPIPHRRRRRRRASADPAPVAELRHRRRRTISCRSSLASQPGLLKNAGPPFVEIHPDDAAARGIADGDDVIVENGRGWVSAAGRRDRRRAAGRGGVAEGPLGEARAAGATSTGRRPTRWPTWPGRARSTATACGCEEKRVFSPEGRHTTAQGEALG